MEELIKGIVEQLVAMTERAVSAETDLDNALSEIDRLEALYTAEKKAKEELAEQNKNEQDYRMYWYKKYNELEEQVIKEKEEEKVNG
jgi:hypothetical protein